MRTYHGTSACILAYSGVSLSFHCKIIFELPPPKFFGVASYRCPQATQNGHSRTTSRQKWQQEGNFYSTLQFCMIVTLPQCLPKQQLPKKRQWRKEGRKEGREEEDGCLKGTRGWWMGGWTWLGVLEWQWVGRWSFLQLGLVFIVWLVIWLARWVGGWWCGWMGCLSLHR